MSFLLQRTKKKHKVGKKKTLTKLTSFFWFYFIYLLLFFRRARKTILFFFIDSFHSMICHQQIADQFQSSNSSNNGSLNRKNIYLRFIEQVQSNRYLLLYYKIGLNLYQRSRRIMEQRTQKDFELWKYMMISAIMLFNGTNIFFSLPDFQ